jgi:hypothetical protein
MKKEILMAFSIIFLFSGCVSIPYHMKKISEAKLETWDQCRILMLEKDERLNAFNQLDKNGDLIPSKTKVK